MTATTYPKIKTLTLLFTEILIINGHYRPWQYFSCIFLTFQNQIGRYYELLLFQNHKNLKIHNLIKNLKFSIKILICPNDFKFGRNVKHNCMGTFC